MYAIIAVMNKNQKCVIIGGAEIKNYDAIKKYFSDDDFFIYCDCGLNHFEKFNLSPNLIIGDFDTYDFNRLENYKFNADVIKLPRAKDDTDTIFAVKEGVKRGFDDFILVGVTGGRLDHTLGNIYILLMLERLNKRAKIVDDFSEIEIISPKNPAHVNNKYKFFSIINISGTTAGLNISNAKFPLNDAEIISEYQYGISNEVLNNSQDAIINIKTGNALLIKIRA